MTVRFLGPDHGIRGIKDKMTRDILAGLEKAGIAVGCHAAGGGACGRRRRKSAR